MSLFFLLVTIVIWGMFAATGLWLLTFFPVLGKISPAGWLPVLCTAFVLAGLSLTRTHYNIFTSLLYYSSYILFGLAFIAFCVSAGCAVLFLLLKICHVSARTYLGIGSVGIMAVLFICALWGGFSAPRLKRIFVSSPRLPALKIALVSDAHLGMGVSYDRWDKALARLENEKPDLLLVLGDVFEYGPHADKYAARLAAFKTPLGSYGVLGNHEYYVGYGNSQDFYKKANVTLLQNELITLPNGVQVAGLKDIKTARVSQQETIHLLSTADKTKPLILLSHTPLYAEEAAAHNTDIMFSGHTHNGQIWPFNYIVRWQFPRVYGLFDVNGMAFYITSGMFYWGIPLRLFAPAELPVIEVNP